MNTTKTATDRNSATRNAESARVPADGDKARPRVGARARIAEHSATTQGNREQQIPEIAGVAEDVPERLFSWPDVIGRVRDYATPPVVWSQPAPPLTELAQYARAGEWTNPDGFWRQMGIGWWRLVALPVTCLCRYTEWICQRPGRLLTLAIVYTLLAHTDFAGWLLPWPSWLP